jgi:hypothetical protein
MESSDIKFRADLTMPFKIDQQPQQPVVLEISDSLETSEQVLQLPYKEKIAEFINSSASWYEASIKKIEAETSNPGKIKLMRIYVLSEQDVDSLVFGLMYRIDSDIEHGRGLKIDGKTLEIIEYGIGDVAFS